MHVGRRETAANGHGKENNVRNTFPNEIINRHLSDAISPWHHRPWSILPQAIARLPWNRSVKLHPKCEGENRACAFENKIKFLPWGIIDKLWRAAFDVAKWKINFKGKVFIEKFLEYF
jgi:hypothetical protein